MKLLKNTSQLKKFKERRRIFLTKGTKIISGELIFENDVPVVESTQGNFNMSERIFKTWHKVEEEVSTSTTIKRPQIGG